MTCEQAAREFSRKTRAAVIGRAARLEISWKNGGARGPYKKDGRTCRGKVWTQERDALLAYCIEAGFNSREAAERIGGGITAPAALNRARELGLEWKAVRRARGASFLSRLSSLRKPEGSLARQPVKERMINADGALWLPFALLSSGQCRYPKGDGEEMRFCAAPALDKKPYCACHWKAAYYKTVFSGGGRNADLMSEFIDTAKEFGEFKAASHIRALKREMERAG
jgi:hypothetical protein